MTQCLKFQYNPQLTVADMLKNSKNQGIIQRWQYPNEKTLRTHVTQSKYYSFKKISIIFFERDYCKVYYTVYIITFTALVNECYRIL